MAKCNQLTSLPLKGLSVPTFLVCHNFYKTRPICCDFHMFYYFSVSQKGPQCTPKGVTKVTVTEK